MCRRQLANAAVDAVRGRDVLQVQEEIQRLPVEAAIGPRVARQRIDLRAKGEALRRHGIVEGLLAEPVAGEEQALLPLVPDGEGEHAAQEAQAVDAMPAVEREDHLGVGVRAEGVAVCLAVAAQSWRSCRFRR